MFTLLYVIFGWLIVVEFLVMFFSSKDDTPADIPALRRPFTQLALIDKQLRTSGQSIEAADQVASVLIPSSLSISIPGI